MKRTIWLLVFGAILIGSAVLPKDYFTWFLEVALFSGQSAEAFLGTQGYVWDTQSDMLLA